MGRGAGSHHSQSRDTNTTLSLADLAANDNVRTHAGWRRAVAAAMAAIFAFSVVIIGLVCAARADIAM